MTDKNKSNNKNEKSTNNSKEEKNELIYKNYPESAPATRDGGTFSMILLILWYAILGMAGLALLGVVALFVTCMV